MLSPADRAVVDRDPALPGLAIVLDATSLAAHIGETSLAPVYLRYKPGTSCTAGFMLPGRGAIAVHAYPTDRFATVRARAEWRELPDVVLIDESCVAVVPSALDRQLRALRRFCSPDRRPRFLRRLLGRRSGIWQGDVELLRYKPGRRLVARLDVDGRARAALKITAARHFTQALIGATGAAALGGAALLGADARRHALVTAWVAGTPVCPVLAGGPPSAEDLGATGSALSRLHTAAFRPAARVTRSDEISALEEVARALAPLDPALARAAARLGAAVAHGLVDAAGDGTLIHGDFSADQVVLRADQPVILDWDHAAWGDPGRDLGTFLARLDLQAIDGALSPAEAEAAGAALCEGYATAHRTLPATMYLQHARALLSLATEGFRIRHPDWTTRTEALLGRAEAVLARSGRGSGSHRSRPRTPDAGIPALEVALNGEAMHPRLSAALGCPPGDLHLATPRLLRHKRGRRALVRYDLAQREGGQSHRISLLGKLRSKGPDLRTPRLHDTLRAAGLDGSTGAGVPAAAGRIDSLGLWLQHRAPGRPLGERLRPGDATEPLARVGRALARLHGIPAETSRVWTLDDECDVLDRALEGAAAENPDLARRCASIRAGARSRLDALGPGPLCGIHRDFYFDQVLVDGGTIWLLDLDLYARGDAAIDIGNFLAHLDELGLRRYGGPDALAAHAAAFLSGYHAAAPVAVDPERIATLRAVSLARHIFLCTRFHDRRHTLAPLLALAEDALGASPGRTPTARPGG